MKVTVNIEDKLIIDVLKYSNASTISDGIRIALKEYTTLKKLRELGQNLKDNPLIFSDFSLDVRTINRRS
jgi:hypothetical protein